jgi:hypothetical protein
MLKNPRRHFEESAILTGGRRGISQVPGFQSEIALPQGGIGMTTVTKVFQHPAGEVQA